MSRISENIRKITKSWGGKTTGNGISDALADLYNNLPFGVKTEMEENLPPTTFTEIENYLTKPLGLKAGKEYTVSVNGTEYKITPLAGDMMGTGSDQIIISDNLNNIDAASFMILEIPGGADGIYGVVQAINGIAPPFTMSIKYEQEVVKQLDPKFVGASGGSGEFVVIFTSNDGATATCDKTFDEIYNKFMSGVNLKFVFHIPFLNVYTVTNNYYIGPENLYISTASYDTAYNSNGFSKLTILDFVIMLTNNNDIHIGQVSRSM